MADNKKNYLKIVLLKPGWSGTRQMFTIKYLHQVTCVSPFLAVLLSSVAGGKMLVETTFGLSVVTAVREASSVDGGGTREESSISTILTARPASLSPSTHQYHPD